MRSNVVCRGFIETAMVRSYLVSAPEGERERRLSKIPAGRKRSLQQLHN